jgi:hypothetical protein
MSPRKLHASSSTCRTRAKGTSDQSTFWEDVEGFEQDVVGGSKQKKANNTRIDT